MAAAEDDEDFFALCSIAIDVELSCQASHSDVVSPSPANHI